MSKPREMLDEFLAKKQSYLNGCKYLSTDERLDGAELDLSSLTEMILGNSILIDHIKDIIVALDYRISKLEGK